jgi:hypothetical protein
MAAVQLSSALAGNFRCFSVMDAGIQLALASQLPTEYCVIT